MPKGIYKRTEETRNNISLSAIGRIPWNKGKMGLQIAWNRGQDSRLSKICDNCTSEYKTYKIKSRFCSQKCSQMYLRDEQNGNWKGSSATYSAVHHWIRNKKGDPSRCEKCGSIGKKIYDWANIDHKYSRNLECWISLCRSCHRKYDEKFK